MSNANDLNKRVSIWKFDRSINAAGTPIEQWLFVKYTYANIKTMGGSVSAGDPEGRIPSTTVKIILRFDKHIDYNCQIRYEKQAYTINYIEEDDRKNFYTLTCVTYNEYLNGE